MTERSHLLVFPRKISAPIAASMGSTAHPTRKAPVARIGLLFPGQASHEAGMASAWLPAAADRYERLSAVVGCDLPSIADDAEACRATDVAQIAIFATSVAALDAFTTLGIAPVVVAGHSLGEIAASVAAGCLTVEDGARVVLARGRAMSRACHTSPGGLVAVLGLAIDDVTALLADRPQVAVANDNGAKQVVIGGPSAALADAAGALREAGARVLSLEVEGAFHTPAMTPAIVALGQAIARTPVVDPAVELISGVTGQTAVDARAVRRVLTDGVLAPVRWAAVQATLAQRDLDLLVEVGPSGVLRGLARRELRDLPCLPLRGPDDLAQLSQHLADLDVDEPADHRTPQPIGARP